MKIYTKDEEGRLVEQMITEYYSTGRQKLMTAFAALIIVGCIIYGATYIFMGFIRFFVK